MTATLILPATTTFLESCGMNYNVTKEPAIQRTLDAEGQPQFNEVKGQFHLVRSTDAQVISPKTVSSKYVPTCPIDMISPVAPLIAEGWVTPEKGYMLSDGSHEVLQFRIGSDMLPDAGKIVGEDWDHFFQLHNFQGAGSFFGNLFSKRLICSNGAVRIVRKSGGFRLRHMGALQTKYEDAMRTWKEVQEEIRKLGERMTVWNDTKIGYQEAVLMFEDIFEIEDPANIPTRTHNELKFAIAEFSNPARGTRGETLADVYNAITSTNTHYAPANSRETETRRLSSLLNPNGSRNRLEGRAIEVLAARTL
jgi:hypothetical protein